MSRSYGERGGGNQLATGRANWRKDSIIEVKTRADDGSETSPSPGHVLKSDTLVVLEESTWDLFTMGEGYELLRYECWRLRTDFPHQEFQNFDGAWASLLRPAGGGRPSFDRLR
jgi:hypothetical protein